MNYDVIIQLVYVSCDVIRHIRRVVINCWRLDLTDTYRHIHTNTQTHKETNTQTHTHTHIHTDRQKQTNTQT